MINRVCVLMAVFLLSSCASLPDKVEKPFDLQARAALYGKNDWSFSGRMSVTDEVNAVSASIEWLHHNKLENIKLSGPFGQGRARIILTDTAVEVEQAGESIRYLGDVDEIVSTQIGVQLPASSLKYWVLGLTEPNVDYVQSESGFMQHGWKVTYLEMQSSGGFELPRKIKIERGKARLKLIINQWGI